MHEHYNKAFPLGRSLVFLSIKSEQLLIWKQSKYLQVTHSYFGLTTYMHVDLIYLQFFHLGRVMN